MMISRQQLLAVIRARSEAPATLDEVRETRGDSATRESDAPARRGDDISLSDRVREMVKVARALEELPEVREELVRDIKKRIEAGSYEVPAEDVAEKAMSRAIIARILEDGETRS
ncbi:MAG: flagellar biosynthesis anti-sigma factor FlgM [Bacillota bacterium]